MVAILGPQRQMCRQCLVAHITHTSHVQLISSVSKSHKTCRDINPSFSREYQFYTVKTCCSRETDRSCDVPPCSKVSSKCLVGTPSHLKNAGSYSFHRVDGIGVLKCLVSKLSLTASRSRSITYGTRNNTLST